MRGIFWGSSEFHNLIDLLWNFDDRPIIHCWQGNWSEEDSVSRAEWLAGLSEYFFDSSSGNRFIREQVEGKFDSSYRPRFARRSILKDGVDTGDEIVQLLDWQSILFFLLDWHSSCSPIIFSGESDLNKVATALAGHYSYRPRDRALEFFIRGDPRRYPRELVSDFTACSRYVIFTSTLYGTVIASRDDALLQSMFEYMVSIGEEGFVYDGTAESQEKRRLMSRGQWNGLYLDEIPAGFAW